MIWTGKNILRIGCLFLFLVLGPVLAASAFAQGRYLEITGVEIEATLLPNGDLEVTERRTIDFYGQFRGADQKIYFEGVSLFSGIQISEGDFFYELVEDFPTFEPGTYSIKVFGDEYFMVDWSFDASNESRTFTLEYIVRDLVLVHDDVAELYYKFVGDEWHNESVKVLVILTLPSGAGEDEVLAWGHGPPHGEVKIESPQQVTWHVAPLPAATFLEGRVVFPLELVPESERHTGIEALPGILAEERRWALQTNTLRVARQYQLYFSLLVVLLCAFYVYRMRRRAANREHAYRGKYYRELPGDYSPVVAGYLWNNKIIKPDYLSAHILDLARRRYIRIEESAAPAGRSERGENDYTLVEQIRESPPAGLDHAVTDFIFGRVYEHLHAEVPDEDKPLPKAVSFQDIQKYAETKSRDFHNFYHSWQAAGKKEAEAQKFYAGSKFFSNWGCLPLFLSMLLGFAAMIFLQLYLFGALLMVLPVIVFFASPNTRFSDYGADQLAKWRAFRRFLLHFSKIERSTVPSLVVWEHYLVYAVVLGVARQVIDQLALVFPRMEQDPAFADTSWAAYRAGQTTAMIYSVNAMNRSLQNTVHSATRVANAKVAAASRSSSSSSSSSSGGFSSGSGSGGGFSSGGGGGFGGGGGSFR